MISMTSMRSERQSVRSAQTEPMLTTFAGPQTG